MKLLPCACSLRKLPVFYFELRIKGLRRRSRCSLALILSRPRTRRSVERDIRLSRRGITSITSYNTAGKASVSASIALFQLRDLLPNPIKRPAAWHRLQYIPHHILFHWAQLRPHFRAASCFRCLLLPHASVRAVRRLWPPSGIQGRDKSSLSLVGSGTR